MAGPKLFVSYSWSSPDHEAWVLQLATDLRQSGVDVVLDKWDLREGHDAHAFMEKMVTDPDIRKVILICDRAYVDKADGRSGGVGTETQIISAEIYAKEAQNKFVAVVTERDEQGRALLPVYYRSRIYIDLSDSSAYAQGFDQLLRWAYDQPLYERPALGERPQFLSAEKGIVLATSSRFKRALDAIRNNREHAVPAAVEYFETLTIELEKIRIDGDVDPYDDAVVRSIESFLPYRNEVIELFLSLALYRDTLETRGIVRRFFEQLIPYLERPPDAKSWRDWNFDNFRFVVHELFLYAVASLVRYERFESAAYLISNEYYIPGRADYGRGTMSSVEVFRQHMKSLEYRNERLQLRRLSVRADLLEQRCKGIGIEFRHLMQADFVIFLRGQLAGSNAGWSWWPETLLYSTRHSEPFEVFARSRSARHFEQAKVLLGIETKEALRVLLETYATGTRQVPRWQFESFVPAQLLGFNDIATKP